MRALQFAPATYYAAISRPTSARAVRDEELVREIQATYDENHFVYGARKIWVALNKRGISVARCTVERLMGDMGLVGARRGRAFKVTTLGDDRLPRPADLVERDFSAPGPNRLWVADLTYVKTHTGWVYVAFVVDVFSRRVVGWQVSTSLRSDLAIDALEMAVYARRDQDLSHLVHHSDRGVQYLSIRYTERLEEAGAVASVGSKGDSYDNALAESFTWKNADDVEWATLIYIDWFNNRRIHSSLGDLSPAEFEAAFYDETESANQAASETTESLRNPV